MTTALVWCLISNVGAPLGKAVRKLGHITHRLTKSVEKLISNWQGEKTPRSNPAMEGGRRPLGFARAARETIFLKKLLRGEAVLFLPWQRAGRLF